MRLVARHAEAGMMPQRDAQLHALCLATVVFALAYATVALGPYYHPIEHRWSMTKLPGTPAMSWYARFAWSGLAALAAVVVAAPLLQRPALRQHLEARPGLSKALACFTLVALTITLAYLAYGEFKHAAGVLAGHS
jgi:hypothetical protein